MDDRKMNQLRMHRKVKGVFAENSAITEKYPPIGASFDTFSGLLEEIEQVSAVRSKSNKGIYEEKEDRKEAMAHEGAELASAASAYAKDKNDAELMAVLAISYSDIRYGDEQTAYNLAKTVHDELLKVKPELENYLISGKDLNVLKKAIDAYHEILEDGSSQDSVARTRQLAGLFKKINDHLNDHLDKLVTRIKRKEPVFYDTYQNARVIVDLGGRRKQDNGSDATM